ncbi:hypothetical protein BDF14DRAFT_686906 [Spinellus fusiger]|nr:hypothetical protein BDF14DRAFT_686906 [Spinellus fusiger]
MDTFFLVTFPLFLLSSLSFSPSCYMSPHTTSDHSFIKFARCLYRVKGLIRNLEEFNQTVFPILKSVPFSQQRGDITAAVTSDTYVHYVRSYVKETFAKLSYLLKMLFAILTKIESSHSISKGQIHSLWQDFREQWRAAATIRSHILHCVQSLSQQPTSLPTPPLNAQPLSIYSLTHSQPFHSC